jgi:predicted nucleic acid-binding protein
MLTLLCQGATRHEALVEDVRERGRALRGRELKDLDALHLAAAEHGGAEVLLTTDDRFIRAARALLPHLPFAWIIR